jgi:hypothetical protein
MRNSKAAEIADALKYAEEDYQLKQQNLSQDIAALDKHGKDYENKLKALNDRQTELTRAHENQITQIKAKAEEERNSRILAGGRRFDDDMSRSLSNVLSRHESFSKAMIGMGDQVASGIMQNAIKSILADDMTKEHDAAAAARKAYLAGMHFPFPANIIMGPLLGAAAFAAVMAFEEGGIVPGVGKGDIVPARLEPGEAVLPKKLTENLSNASRFGGGDSGGHTHIHINHSPTIHAMDSEGFDRVLKKNADSLTRHLHGELRKLNR